MLLDSRAWQVRGSHFNTTIESKSYLYESEERIVRLPEDKCDAVDRMITFFYKRDYPNFSGNEFTGRVEVFAAAIKYEVTELACSDLNNSIPNNSESTQFNSWHSIWALCNSILEQN